MVEQRTENPLSGTKVMGPGRKGVTVRGSELKRLEKLLDMNMPKEKILEAMKPNNRRGNGHNVPEGGISIRKAAVKFGISRMTVSRLAKSGKVRIIKRTPNWLYIDESDLANYLSK